MTPEEEQGAFYKELRLSRNTLATRALCHINALSTERDTYRALCVELQATVANLHSQIRDKTVEKFCCGNPIQDNGYVCCGDEEAEWPDWALEAMRTADEMNAKAEQVLGDDKKDPV